MTYRHLQLILSLSLLNMHLSVAQQATIFQAREAVYRGYIQDEETHWQKGLELLRQACGQPVSCSEAMRYELALTEYGYIGFCLAHEQKEKAQSYLESCEAHARSLLGTSYEAEVHAILGGLMGIKMGLSPASAIWIGPKSLKHIEAATQKGKDKAAGWVETGNMRLHSPALFGGSVDKAIHCYQKAIRLFEQRPEAERRCWLYLHAYAWLGQAWQKKGMKAEARKVYEQVLKIEPNFRWVKNELLPALSEG